MLPVVAVGMGPEPAATKGSCLNVARDLTIIETTE